MIYLDERTVESWIENLKVFYRQKLYMDKEEINLGFDNLANLYLNTVNIYNIDYLTDEIFELLPKEVKECFKSYDNSYKEIEDDLKAELNLKEICYEDIEENSVDEIHDKFIEFYPDMMQKIKNSFSDMNLVSMEDVLCGNYDTNYLELEFIFRIYDNYVSQDLYEKLLEINSHECRYIGIPEELEEDFDDSIRSILEANTCVDYYNCFFSKRKRDSNWEKLSDMHNNVSKYLGNTWTLGISDEYNLFDNLYALVEITPSFNSYDVHIIKKVIVFIYVFFYLLGGYEI